eukprot:CAMPEP_0171000032 /NCGR_PEP_ID=MMETSP0736-20130129/14500_1 /TAXON_ID=186038 /ORGANISM="Fragilariopsis kerguelensis, Strain L26-C5" /LENGTH=85 /DNA_ID=CAMNT_0011427409 /DNA_START=1 /DNA_END=254 /DNA_ORIENTATION=-
MLRLRAWPKIERTKVCSVYSTFPENEPSVMPPPPSPTPIGYPPNVVGSVRGSYCEWYRTPCPSDDDDDEEEERGGCGCLWLLLLP